MIGVMFKLIYYHPQTKLGQGYIFTGICDSVHREGGGVCLSACWDTTHTPWQGDTPLARRHTPWQGDTPPGKETPLRSACWEIRSTSGRYASYWNAILVSMVHQHINSCSLFPEISNKKPTYIHRVSF